MITYKTNLEEIPSSCAVCPCHWCRLPLCCNARGGVIDKVKKTYTKKRHKDCPLVDIIVVGGKK